VRSQKFDIDGGLTRILRACQITSMTELIGH
jgi:hypothetical protein